MQGEQLVGLMCGLVVWLTVGSLVGAVFLRAAIALYNAMAGGAGSPSSVPEPTFGKGMLISLAISFVNGVVGALIGFLTAGTAAAAGQQGNQALTLVAQGVAFVVSLFVGAGMLSSMLPTTFGRALLVILCYGLIAIVVIGVFAVLAFVVMGIAFRRA